jgi:hypothetical protein
MPLIVHLFSTGFIHLTLPFLYGIEMPVPLHGVLGRRCGRATHSARRRKSDDEAGE